MFKKYRKLYKRLRMLYLKKDKNDYIIMMQSRKRKYKCIDKPLFKKYFCEILIKTSITILNCYCNQSHYFLKKE